MFNFFSFLLTPYPPSSRTSFSTRIRNLVFNLENKTYLKLLMRNFGKFITFRYFFRGVTFNKILLLSKLQKIYFSDLQKREKNKFEQEKNFFIKRANPNAPGEQIQSFIIFVTVSDSPFKNIFFFLGGGKGRREV